MSATRFASPVAAASVGIQSLWAIRLLKCAPGWMTFGHFTSNGTRWPPSLEVPFSPLNGEVPPSGQLNFSAPLSVVYMTMVLSAIPRSSSFFSS
ncbi:hypothetical protein D3C86_1760750 [compost metagenome]